ncbi:MAG TPA: hypothetical protein PKI99_03985, partial [Terrimesophilobacter sp.]|nr:hypothetical protein [Terrimesophilobacter sp.]
ERSMAAARSASLAYSPYCGRGRSSGFIVAAPEAVCRHRDHDYDVAVRRDRLHGNLPVPFGVADVAGVAP